MFTALTALTTLISPTTIQAAGAIDIPPLSSTTIDTGVNGTIALDDQGRPWTWDLDGTTSPVVWSGFKLQQVISDDSIRGGTGTDGTPHKVRTGATSQNVIGDENPDVTEAMRQLPKSKMIAAYGSDIYSIDMSDHLQCVPIGVGSNSFCSQLKLLNLGPARSITSSGTTYNSGAGAAVVTVLMDGMVYEWLMSAQNPAPQKVNFPDGVIIRQASANAHNGVALDSEGQAWAWGFNDYGQIGDGTTTNRSDPVKVIMPNGVKFTHIAVGLHYVVAIDTMGQAWSWGDNSSWNLGTGNTKNSSIPVKVNMPSSTTRFTEITTGMMGMGGWTTAKAENGDIWTWGGTGTKNMSTPVGNGKAIVDNSRMLRAFDFSDTSKPSGGDNVTVISCAPTTGVTPTGLSAVGFAAIGLGLIGALILLVKGLRI